MPWLPERRTVQNHRGHGICLPVRASRTNAVRTVMFYKLKHNATRRKDPVQATSRWSPEAAAKAATHMENTMMKRLYLALAILIGAPSLAAAATVAVSTGNVNLRAGPSTVYPVVTVVPAGTRITTYGCVSGYSWCDVSFGAYRGWVSASYIQVVYRGNPVIVTPVVAPAVGLTVVAYNRAYWDTYYAAYPWYGRWGHYYRPGYPVAPAARVTSHDRAVTCTGDSCTATRTTTGIYGGSASQSRTCANGECNATRNVVGPYGGTASRTRNCSTNSQSCTVSRTGPAGGTRTRVFQR